jgi:hypothetical protein
MSHRYQAQLGGQAFVYFTLLGVRVATGMRYRCADLSDIGGSLWKLVIAWTKTHTLKPMPRNAMSPSKGLGYFGTFTEMLSEGLLSKPPESTEVT